MNVIIEERNINVDGLPVRYLTGERGLRWYCCMPSVKVPSIGDGYYPPWRAPIASTRWIYPASATAPSLLPDMHQPFWPASLAPILTLWDLNAPGL